MTVEIRMPALSPTMEKGTLSRWLVREGDLVQVGDLVAEVENDKATMEIEAEQAGRISMLVVGEGGDDVPVGTVIALLNEDGGAAELALTRDAADAEPVIVPQAAVIAVPPKVSEDARTATPLAYRIASACGIDLASVASENGGRRIRLADLGIGALRSTTESSRENRSIAETAVAAATAPPFHLSARCRVSGMMELCAGIAGSAEMRGLTVEPIDFFAKAFALALVQTGIDDAPEIRLVEPHRPASGWTGAMVRPAKLSPSAIAAARLDGEAVSGPARITLYDLSGSGLDAMQPSLQAGEMMALTIAGVMSSEQDMQAVENTDRFVMITASFMPSLIGEESAVGFFHIFREFLISPIWIVA